MGVKSKPKVRFEFESQISWCTAGAEARGPLPAPSTLSCATRGCWLPGNGEAVPGAEASASSRTEPQLHPRAGQEGQTVMGFGWVSIALG